jgi:hypothetical protein
MGAVGRVPRRRVPTAALLQIVVVADRVGEPHAELTSDRARYVSSSIGTDDVLGVAFRLDAALAFAS